MSTKFGLVLPVWIHCGKGELSVGHVCVCGLTFHIQTAPISLCFNRWGKVSAYETGFAHQHSYKKLYMLLDNGTLTFTADPHEVRMK